MHAHTPATLPHHAESWRVLTWMSIALVAGVGLMGIVLVEQPSSSRADRVDIKDRLTTIPSMRAAVGPIMLDGSLAAAIDLLGEPDALGPDIVGVSRLWWLQGGAELSVTTPVGAAEPIEGIVVTIPRASSVRVGLYGGLLLGDASILDVVRAWGDPEAVGRPSDDFDLRYIECRGPFPIVLKVQRTAAFDRVLVAYADEPPGSNGCGSTSV